MWITWKHQDTELSLPLKIEQKIDLFYEQALGWQLHIADLVANGGTAFGEDGRREGHATASVDTQIRPLIDTSKPAIN